MTNVFTKDPDANLDYQWDWSDWLTVGETISSYSLTVPSGLTLGTNSNTTTKVNAFLSGGTVDTGYQVVCHIETNQGREDDRSIYLRCRER